MQTRSHAHGALMGLHVSSTNLGRPCLCYPLRTGCQPAAPPGLERGHSPSQKKADRMQPEGRARPAGWNRSVGCSGCCVARGPPTRSRRVTNDANAAPSTDAYSALPPSHAASLAAIETRHAIRRCSKTIQDAARAVGSRVLLLRHSARRRGDRRPRLLLDVRDRSPRLRSLLASPRQPTRH